MASPRRPMPDDFPAVMPTLTYPEAQKHWRTGQSTLYRWSAEAGVTGRGHSHGALQVAKDKIGRLPRTSRKNGHGDKSPATKGETRVCFADASRALLSAQLRAGQFWAGARL